MRNSTGTLAFALAVTVFGQVLYHTVARGADRTRSAFELIAVTYMVSLTLVLIIGFGTQQVAFSTALSRDNVGRAMGLGIGVSLVELGYIYAYRRGLPIATGALSVLTISTVALGCVGLAIFRESISPRVIVGALLALLGVWLMRS
jgi:drug/metabolite transporter (DMT)-like permease